MVRHDIKNHMISLKNLNSNKEDTKFNEDIEMLGSYYADFRDIPHKLVYVLLWLQPEKYSF